MKPKNKSEKKTPDGGNRGRIIRLSAALALDLAVPVAVLVALLLLGHEKNAYPAAFCYFTTDSNLLAALSCLAIAPFLFRRILNPDAAIPRALSLLRFVSSVALAVTLLTVMCFLGPVVYSYPLVLSGHNLYLHLIAPVLSLVSTLFFEDGETIGRKTSLLGAIPVFLYGTVYAICVLGVKCWDDVYGLNGGGHWYISLLTFLFGAFLLSLGIAYLRKNCLLSDK